MKSLSRSDFRDQADQLIKIHQKEAEESFQSFRQSLISDLKHDLKSIDTQLKKQLSSVCRKLENRIRNNYTPNAIKSSFVKFFLQPYVAKEYENVQKSIRVLKKKIFEYVQNFSSNLLERNIQKFQDISLFHFQNTIKHVYPEWYSVTSRSPLEKAQITVAGLRRPETSWLILGVSKKLKEYGPVKKSINSEQFLGNIYLNGTENFEGAFKVMRNLAQRDMFVIENVNRMIYVYKKKQGRNIEQTFILDDNTDYYFYIAMKGPLTISFEGQ